MSALPLSAIGVAGLLALYAYAGYPLALALLASRTRARRPGGEEPEDWPLVSFSIAMYNEEDQATELVESLLAIDYPPERRQILIVSDGSIDRTVELLRSFESEGVEVVELEERSGKTAAENAASERLRGEIIVNTDASIRILPNALKPLIRSFSDPQVGLASGRDVSVTALDDAANIGESGYVGYEMKIRDLETRLYGIVGASGCFYAIRSELHRIPVPGHLSRDFAAALKCEEHGLRAVSVPEAVCLVPRTHSLHREYSRKVRTITRGMETLLDRKHLLNPLGHPVFSWMLISHKVCRWLVPWAGIAAFVGLVVLAVQSAWAVPVLAVALLGLLLGTVGWVLGDGRPLPSFLQVPGFALAGNLAAIHASIRVVLGRSDAVWEPTRRGGSSA